MKLFLMRHGATQGNAQRRYVGRRTDEPLSAEGQAQCQQAGVCERVQKVYVSPLLRARQTAQLCFPQARLQVVAGLEEFDFGSFEGRTAQEMRHDKAYRAWVESGCVAPCPGGESRASYVARSNAALLGALREAALREDRQVIVVAHGGTIMAALSELVSQGPGVPAHTDVDSDDAGADAYFRWHVSTCEGYEAEVLWRGTALELCNPQRLTVGELCDLML